jgi:FADH2 O2-dependent halogenase
MASHFEGVEPLSVDDDDPYPAGRAAVHHLIEEGWIYELPFDHGVTSLGLILDSKRSQRLGVGDLSAFDPKLLDTLWQEVIDRYPALSSRFAKARRLLPWVTSKCLQRCWSRAAGPDWALLPSTLAFWSPLFSTGIAWSLVGVERLAEILSPDRQRSLRSGLREYGEQLQSEAEHLRRLTEVAYRTLADLDRFHAVALVYFAAASYGETMQRLRDHGPDGRHWSSTGFLGTGDPVLRRALDWILVQLELPAAGQQVPGTVWVDQMREFLAPRDVVGLDRPVRPGVYGADLALLRSHLDRLGADQLDPQDLAGFEDRLRC